MYSATLESLFSVDNLTRATQEINRSTQGIDGESWAMFESNISKNIHLLHDDIITGEYCPQPIKHTTIPKPNSDETRPIALSSIKDKIVQSTLSYYLGRYFEKSFSLTSYAYRPQKSVHHAIKECRKYLVEGKMWVIRSDIDNFFETIDHERLLYILTNEIEDRRIVRIISLFLQNGIFHRFDYKNHEEGVHQGDILSPLLSNIYLDQLDKYLEREHISFVRYADDFTLFLPTEKLSKVALKKVVSYVKDIKLTLEESKTTISHARDGFIFLGVRFEGHHVAIDNERIQRYISRFFAFTKETITFEHYIEKINTYTKALKNHLLKIVDPTSEQVLQLQSDLIESLAQKVYLAKKQEEVTTKGQLKKLLDPFEGFLTLSKGQKKDTIDRIINKGFEKYLATKEYKKSKTPLEKKKEEYSKQFALISTVVISTHGTSLGYTRGRISIKIKGKIDRTIPANNVERIVITTTAATITGALVKMCAEKKIAIDFIDKETPYASFVTYAATLAQNTPKQVELLTNDKGFQLAFEFIEGKAKNQINYIKYLERYHSSFAVQIKKMENILSKAKEKAKNANELMGYEGEIAVMYWSCVKQIVPDEYGFTSRVTQGARDTINSCLNYAYAILYGKVQSSLIKAGLSLHVSYLHALDKTKPTLVYDAIEEFRTFVVDRTIFAMAGRKIKLSVNNEGLLNEKTKKKITQEILKKLGSYTNYKKEKVKVDHIIEQQAYRLSRHIDGTERYNAFVAKF